MKIFDSFDALNDIVEADLCRKSIEAQAIAYAPYSKLRVGAVALMDNGKTVFGSNQENAVYPLGLCAERVAIFSANNVYPKAKIIKLALSTSGDSVDPAFPCGSCRQVILEEEYKVEGKIKILVVTKDKRVFVIDSVREILPFPFTREELL